MTGVRRTYRIPADDYPLLFPQTRTRIREATMVVWAFGEVVHALVRSRLAQRVRP